MHDRPLVTVKELRKARIVMLNLIILALKPASIKNDPAGFWADMDVRQSVRLYAHLCEAYLWQNAHRVIPEV